MDKVAEVGEFVYYNGKLDPYGDHGQNDLIRKFLKIGEGYEISDILIDYGGYKDNSYYSFRYVGRDTWFHYKCFDRDDKANLIRKYGLK